MGSKVPLGLGERLGNERPVETRANRVDVVFYGIRFKFLA